ncbi:LAFA_0E14400g1_1 [Lachancea sp. 'fantastica']|nr:LAFA_0E14400g1_1 [Lachancea sp. 'fantastica']
MASKMTENSSSQAEKSDSRPALKEKATNLPLNTAKPNPKDTNQSTSFSQQPRTTTEDTMLEQAELPDLLNTDNEQRVKIEEVTTLSLKSHPIPSEAKKMANSASPNESPTVKRAKTNLGCKEVVMSCSSSFLPPITAVRNDTPSSSDSKNEKDMQELRHDDSPSKPDAYQPLSLRLYDSDRAIESQAYYEGVFREVKDESERAECIEFAKMDLRAWTASGDRLQQEQRDVLARLVEARMLLSAKFEVITDLVNERALALNEQGLLLDRKLKKIQDLGKEILDII